MRRSLLRLFAAAAAEQFTGLGFVRVIYEEARDRVTREHRDEIERMTREKEIADRMIVTLLDTVDRQDKEIARLRAELTDRT